MTNDNYWENKRNIILKNESNHFLFYYYPYTDVVIVPNHKMNEPNLLELTKWFNKLEDTHVNSFLRHHQHPVKKCVRKISCSQEQQNLKSHRNKLNKWSAKEETIKLEKK